MRGGNGEGGKKKEANDKAGHGRGGMGWRGIAFAGPPLEAREETTNVAGMRPLPLPGSLDLGPPRLLDPTAEEPEAFATLFAGFGHSATGAPPPIAEYVESEPLAVDFAGDRKRGATPIKDHVDPWTSVKA